MLIIIINYRVDYWKSQGRKFCDFCKCWIADNKPSIDFHEGGKKHKENVGKRLKEIYKNSTRQAKQNKKFEDDLKKMENVRFSLISIIKNMRYDNDKENIYFSFCMQAAMAAYLKDVENNTRDMTAAKIINEKANRIEPKVSIPNVKFNKNLFKYVLDSTVIIV